MSHANARLTVHGRLLLVQRVASGRPAAHVARELGISRQCAYRWVRGTRPGAWPGWLTGPHGRAGCRAGLRRPWKHGW